MLAGLVSGEASLPEIHKGKGRSIWFQYLGLPISLSGNYIIS